ncbi:hypothetical protein Z945_2394 [Sulfitobacter noctilucae]|uniref:DUF5333 domain-containing protein n=1 Tax=Sulfitobacter noctilucae TaxID=1342302 RepID=UPI0004683F6A|nr:DUF5333 domain-containing protein [Sulfitobacter noctilucae]KIN61402.1 hypothetical protein Z945_2394 [Sulfitobacter noctilucae]
MKTLVAAVLGAAILATPVMAKTPLREVAAIDDALFDLGIADIVRKNCPTIAPRMFKAIGYVRNLERQARDLGYTEAEIEAYTDSDAEKNRLRRKAATFFQARGVDTSDPQSYCVLGMEEIQKSSRIGSLLRAK